MDGTVWNPRFQNHEQVSFVEIISFENFKQLILGDDEDQGCGIIDLFHIPGAWAIMYALSEFFLLRKQIILPEFKGNVMY